jgi:hypothetical protein
MSCDHLSSMTFATPAYICVVLLQLVALSEVAAQTTVPRPTVTRAFDVFENYPERVSVGTDIVFKRKASEAARKLVHSGLHIRIFSLRADETEPTPITTIDGCDVYLSVVHALERTHSTDVRFGTMDHTWLSITSSGNSISDGRYFFVFEQAGPTTNQFRLKAEDAKAYFSTGFRVVVFNDGKIDLDTVRAEYEKRRRTLGNLYVAEDTTLKDAPCYTYRKLTVDATVDLQLAQAPLEYCSLQTSQEGGI